MEEKKQNTPGATKREKGCWQQGGGIWGKVFPDPHPRTSGNGANVRAVGVSESKRCELGHVQGDNHPGLG